MSSTRRTILVVAVLTVSGIILFRAWNEPLPSAPASALHPAGATDTSALAAAEALQGREPGVAGARPSLPGKGFLSDGIALAERASSATGAGLGNEFEKLLLAPPSDDRDLLAKLLLRRWGELDPLGALGFLAARAGISRADQGKYAVSVYEGWAASDLAAAWESAIMEYETLPGYGAGGVDSQHGTFGSQRLRAIAMVAIAAGKFETLAPLLADAPGNSTEGATGLLAESWAKRDGQAALAWLLDLPSGPSAKRANGMIGFVRAMAAQDLPLVDRLLGSLPERRDRQSVATGVVLALNAAGKRAEAGHWLLERLPGQPDDAFGLAAQTWFAADRANGTLEMPRELVLLEKMGPGTNQGTAVRSYIAQIRNEAPDVALVAAIRYSNPNLREESALDLAQSWAKANPQVATDFITRSKDIPEDLRTRLLQAVAVTTGQSSPP